MHKPTGMPILTPYQATAAPATPMTEVGARVSVMTNQKLATAPTQRLLSNVRDVIGNSNKMLKPCRGQEKYPFFLKNATVAATTAQGKSKKKCISLPKGKL